MAAPNASAAPARVSAKQAGKLTTRDSSREISQQVLATLLVTVAPPVLDGAR